MDLGLRDKIVLVTGATRGIGRAVANRHHLDLVRLRWEQHPVERDRVL